LLDFVPPENRSEMVPCHYISWIKAGDTIEDAVLNLIINAIEAVDGDVRSRYGSGDLKTIARKNLGTRP